MWLDIILCLILLGSIIWGYRSGFVHTFLHTAGWLLSIVLSFAWYPMISEILKEKTSFYDMIQEKLSSHLTEGGTAATSDILSGLPSILKETTDASTDFVAQSFATGLSDLLFSIAAILLIIAGIKFIFFLLTALFSKKNNGGITGWFDGIFGAIFGGIRGIVIILILLALFVPLTQLTSNTFLPSAMEKSHVTQLIYNENPLLFFTNLLNKPEVTMV